MYLTKIGQRFAPVIASVLCLLLLSGCAETELVSHYAKKWVRGKTPSEGSYKVGSPYKVDGTWYYPQESFSHSETGIASWYGPDFHGKHTANGEVYDQYELTAAHRTLQMPSLVRVTNLENGRSIVVRVNDRGPFKRGRVIDVSRRGAELLGFIGKGTARVRLDVLESESRRVADAARRGMDTSRMTVADLSDNRYAPPPVTQMAPLPAPGGYMPPDRVRLAAYGGGDAESLPESLQTPTITVEELAMPGRPLAAAPAPTWDDQRDRPPLLDEPPVAVVVPPASRQERAEFVNKLDLGAPAATESVSGRYENGNFMPDPVVTQAPVRPTGIFVQAGSFSVFDNAQRLAQKLSSIAPVSVDPVTVKGREFYRVRLGPLASVSEADAVLDRVISVGGDGTARVVKGH